METSAAFSGSSQTGTPTAREVGQNLWLSLQEGDRSQGRSSHGTALGHSPRAHPREQPMSTFMGAKAVDFGEPPRLGANLKIRPHGKLLPNCYFPNNL